MKLLSQKRHAIDFLFPVTVFFVFTISALTVILLAARIYQSTTDAVPILPGKLQPQSIPSVLFPGKYTAWLFHYPLYHHPSVDV